MKDGVLHQLVTQAAERQPEAAALVDGGRVVAYAELERRANQLAHLLVGLGVKRGDRVGLCIDKSAEAVAALYGALKAGAAYVPLDTAAPPARLGWIASDCGIRWVVTGGAKSALVAQMASWGAPPEHVVVLGEQADAGTTGLPAGVAVSGADAVAAQPESAPAVSVAGSDLAYVLYTSGSTGAPKGVMLSHDNGWAFVAWAARHFGLGPEDRLSSHAPLHFDLSVFDLFAASAAGACVVLVPPAASVFPGQLRRFVEAETITTWYSVPSVLTALVERGGLGQGDLPALRRVLFAGEVFPTRYLRELMRRLPHVGFANLFGPTETNVCTCFDLTSLPEEPVPIGAPIDGVELYVVDEGGELAPPGQVGELYVRGPTVMQGYWGQAKLTARSLVALPPPAPGDGKAYRTGDLVKLGDDGNYRFLGRRDSQVKSRGYRIELGEIEAVLGSHPAVLESAAVALPDELVTNRIVACLAATRPLEPHQLDRFCARRLPRYMVPERFYVLDGLPKTSTGKIDRQAVARLAEVRDPA